jgi:hypothetical protein
MGTSAVAQLGAVEASGLSTTLPRRDVERAIKAKKGPPELILDVTRSGDGETRSVAVQWTKADLEELLGQSSGDTVTLTFKAEDLLPAFEDPEVEPHGIREALLVTVAAGSLAGAAMASPADRGWAAGEGPAVGAGIEQVRSESGGIAATPADFRAIEDAAAAQAQAAGAAIEQARSQSGGIAATPADFRAIEDAAAAQARAEQMSAVEQVRGETTTPQAATGMVPDTDPSGRYTVDPTAQPAGPDTLATAPGVSPDRTTPAPAEFGAPRAMPADYAAPTEVASPDRITPATPEYGMPQATPADYAAPATSEAASPDIVSGGYGAPAEFGAPRAMPADYETPAGDTGGGISIEAPSPTTTGLIAGALGLAITAAAFAFDRRRRVRPQQS